MYKKFVSCEHSISEHYSFLGIYPVWTGHLTAQENYVRKPRVLDDYFLIFVSSGEGHFRCMGKDYLLEKFDAYFLFPGVVHSYETHPEKLLDLWWVGFNGSTSGQLLKEMGISPEKPIIRHIQHEALFDVIQDMIEIPDEFSTSDLLKASGNLYKMMGILMEICSPNTPCRLDCKKNYSKPVMRAIHFMNANYPQPITIEQVAHHSGLSRSHFAVIFKRETGCAPVTYLEILRLQNAKRYLEDTRLSITEVAHSVGFQDALYFSRVFKKSENKTPSEYRKSCLEAGCFQAL